ncbi:unnamed protein product [Menidia menidia]|uniref:(Atlantic silverside) hypothetical protein n=1 Tax=Menidia menidia TaxID=238744 RepID=A0A8S4AF98_9TELE|nr:unnamed protein product [Menidia menidia]
MSSLTVEGEQKWVPTHVLVTVLKGRGLRGKGKHGTSDVYTIIQLGKEKYSTGVVDKTTEPEWREECSFELQPGVLEGGGRSGYPAGSRELILTVMHRALIGQDAFLGQAVIQLDKVFHESRCLKNEWYRLHSKTGKKEKERGDIQVTIQFTRNNLTASMYDLVMKDKGASTFSKLKERIKGKRRSSDDDSSSVVMPGGYGSLYRLRHRLPSDGGGEEEYEDDEGGEARRSKMRTFFFRGKLRKSSDTRSSTSLGSESSESSSRGGSLSPTAGISVVVSDLSNSPSNSSNLTADNSPDHTANTSPKSSSLRCEFGDEAGEITIAVPLPTVCVNGSHSYKVQPSDPGSGKPAASTGLAPLQKTLPLSVSLQNLSTRPFAELPVSPVGDGRRWSFDRPGEEEKAAIAAALEKSGPMLGEEEEEPSSEVAPPSSASKAELEIPGRKQRRNFFSHGRSESAGKGQSQPKDESEQVQSVTEEKHKGWFGSKDAHSKPSLVVSPKVEPCTDPHPPPLPPIHHPLGPPVHSASVVSTLHHSNPFCHSQTSPPPISPCNPFFSLLQQNPFYEDMLSPKAVKPSPPPLPYLSSSRPPITQLFPQPRPPVSDSTHDSPHTEGSIAGAIANSETPSNVARRPLPPTPTEGQKNVIKKPSNPFMSVGKHDLDSEWDESFEAFAAGRLQSPEDLATEYRAQQNMLGDHPPEPCNNEALPPVKDADGITNIYDSPHHQLGTRFEKPYQVTSQNPNTNAHHFDTFPPFLETIPEHRSFEIDNLVLNTLTNPPNAQACTEPEQNNNTTNDLADANTDAATFHTLSTQLTNISPDPTTSGLGSSAEEDGLSCFSSHSEKFSGSSSEEAETSIICLESSPELTVIKNMNLPEFKGGIAEGLVDNAQRAGIQHEDGETLYESSSEGSLTPQLQETGSQSEAAQTTSFSNLYPDLLPKVSETPLNDASSDEGIEALNVSTAVSPEELGDCPVNKTTNLIPGCPDDEITSTLPTFHITTSSPDVKQDLLAASINDPSTGEREVNQDSSVPFNLFADFHNISHIANSPGQELDSSLLPAQVSDRSGSSFLQSFYVSANSQDYQSCFSHPSSKPSSDSELTDTLHSANSTLCGDESNIQVSTDAAGTHPGNTSTPGNKELDQSRSLEESFFRPQDKMAISEPRDGSLVTSLALPGPEVLGDLFSKWHEEQNPALHRSQSEGNLAPPFDEPLAPSFGSDPGAIQGSSSALLGPQFLSPISFAPSLTPESGSSSPVALCALPPLFNLSAPLPPSTAQGTGPKPVPEDKGPREVEQQNSPHPVKPLTTATLAEEKRSVLATGLEKLKSSIHPGKSSQITDQGTDRRKSLTEGAGSYYHLTHSELVALLVEREAELERQRAEFQRQKLLLAKREVELKKLKPQVRDLEDYIDTLLVRIMEQKPTLLQVRSKLK